MNCSHKVLSNYTHQEMSAYTHINMTICQKAKALSCLIKNSNNRKANIFRKLALVALNITSTFTKTGLFKVAFTVTYKLTHKILRRNAKTITSPLKINDLNSDPSLVAYYPFNGDANDYSGNGNHGTVYGATLVEGRSGQCYNFDGVNDYIDCGSSPILKLNTGGTISAWVNFTSFNGTSWSNTIVGKGGSSWANHHYILFKASGTNKLLFSISDGSNYLNGNGPYTTDINLNEWYYVVATWDSTKKSIYLNGQLCQSVNSIIMPIDTPAPVSIGRTGSNGYYTDGCIEDVRIYNRALSADEIGLLYETSSAKKFISKYVNKNSLTGSIKAVYNFIKSTGKNTFQNVIKILSGDTRLTSKTFLGLTNIKPLRDKKASLEVKSDTLLNTNIFSKIVFKVTNILHVLKTNIKKDIISLVTNANYKIHSTFVRPAQFFRSFLINSKSSVSNITKIDSHLLNNVKADTFKANRANKRNIADIRLRNEDIKRVNKQQKQIIRINNVFNYAINKLKEIFANYRFNSGLKKITSKGIHIDILNLVEDINHIRKQNVANIKLVPNKITSSFKAFITKLNIKVVTIKSSGVDFISSSKISASRETTNIFSEKRSEYIAQAKALTSKIWDKIITTTIKFTQYFEKLPVIVFLKEIISQFGVSNSIITRDVFKINITETINTQIIKKFMNKYINADNRLISNTNKMVSKTIYKAIIKLDTIRELIAEKVINTKSKFAGIIKLDIFKVVRTNISNQNLMSKAIKATKNVLVKVQSNKIAHIESQKDMSYKIKSATELNILKNMYHEIVAKTSKIIRITSLIVSSIINNNTKTIKDVDCSLENKIDMYSNPIKSILLEFFGIIHITVLRTQDLAKGILSNLAINTAKQTQTKKNNKAATTFGSFILNKQIGKIKENINIVSVSIKKQAVNTFKVEILRIKTNAQKRIPLVVEAIINIKLNFTKVIIFDKIIQTALIINNKFSRMISKRSELIIKAKTKSIKFINKQIIKINKLKINMLIVIENVKHIFYAKLDGAWKELIGLYVKSEGKWRKVLELSKKEKDKWINK